MHVEGAYPGVDVVDYGNQGQLEYDFVVVPGADPEQLRLGVTGAAPLRLDKDGSLVLATSSGTVSQHPPVVYQQVDGVRRAVEGSYVLLGPTRSASASAPMTATGEGPGLHARYHRAGCRHGHQGRPDQDDIVGVRRLGHGGQLKGTAADIPPAPGSHAGRFSGVAGPVLLKVRPRPG